MRGTALGGAALDGALAGTTLRGPRREAAERPGTPAPPQTRAPLADRTPGSPDAPAVAVPAGAEPAAALSAATVPVAAGLAATLPVAADPVAADGAQSARPGRSPRVLMVTEGTYPFVMGGVSTWCDLVLTGIRDVEWLVFALTGPEAQKQGFELPPQARMAAHLQLWGSGHDGARRAGRRRGALRHDLAATLVEGLLGWEGDVAAVAESLVWCRQHPELVLPTFRDDRTWDAYLAGLTRVLAERHPEVGSTPELDHAGAVGLYQTLSWVARVGATPTPEHDVSLVTAAGWAGLPAIVDKVLHGRPLMLSEHGIYVREAYLAAVRSAEPASARFVSTRLARGLTRATYAFADLVSPVAEANRAWEEALGVPPERIRTIPNGVPAPAGPQPPPRTRTVVTVGRIDPLKDVQTMLRVAAEVRRRLPDVTFLHYGPVQGGQEAYGRACVALHAELGLEDTFRFMGPTKDPTGVMRDADVVIMTSISEGFPMSVLEALSQARPVVTTLVGGVLDAMCGAGATAAPGDVHGLADAVTTLLLDPDLAETLGRRGYERVRREFGQQRCLLEYRQALGELAAAGAQTGALS